MDKDLAIFTIDDYLRVEPVKGPRYNLSNLRTII
jgi:hypothetical protein